MNVTKVGLALTVSVLLVLPACKNSNPVETSRAPIAVPGGTYAAFTGEAILFDGTASSDPAGSELTYDWDFGNGGKGTGATPTFTYNTPGTFNVGLVVTNAQGKKSPRTTTTATITQWESSTLAKDDFGRNLDDGWGNADVGGEWILTRSGSDAFSVGQGRGLIMKSDTSMRNAFLTGGYGRDVQGLASFTIDRAPEESAFYTVQVYARRDDTPAKGRGNHHYRYRIRAHRDRDMDLHIDKTVGGVLGLVQDQEVNTAIPVRWAPGAKFWIRWEAVGAAPTTLRMKVWKDGTSEPEGWQLEVAHTEPALDAPGGTGFRVSGPNIGQAPWPVSFTLGDLEYVKL